MWTLSTNIKTDNKNESNESNIKKRRKELNLEKQKCSLTQPIRNHIWYFQNYGKTQRGILIRGTRQRTSRKIFSPKPHHTHILKNPKSNTTTATNTGKSTTNKLNTTTLTNTRKRKSHNKQRTIKIENTKTLFIKSARIKALINYRIVNNTHHYCP